MTTRNNEERLGVSDIHSEAPVDVAGGQASPEQRSLTFAVPTLFVELPSRGQYYAPEHPFHGKEEVELRFMTAKEEDILASKVLVKKGVAVDRMLQNLIVTPGVKVDDLLIGDKNALVIAARISGYGEDYAVRVECPSCELKQEFEFDLTDKNMVFGNEDIDDEERENLRVVGDSYFITVPLTGAEFEVKLLTGKDEEELRKRTEIRKKAKKPEATTTEQLKVITKSISGVTNRLQIADFIERMPAQDTFFLREVYRKLTPNVDLTQEFVCKECSFSGEMDVPITVGFFWPKR